MSVSNVVAVNSAAPIASAHSGRFAAFVSAILSWESLAFAVICMGDMISTIYLVRHGMAMEANPWLASCYRLGEGCFIAAKMLSFVPALVVAAYFRERFPNFVALCLRCALGAYVLIYIFATVRQVM